MFSSTAHRPRYQVSVHRTIGPLVTYYNEHRLDEAAQRPHRAEQVFNTLRDGMLKVCSVKDLLFRISSARVKFRSRPVSRSFLFPVGTGR